MKNYKFWFCTGSQDLYGDECLRKVAEHSAKIVEGLNNGGKLPFEVVLKPTLISQASIRQTLNDANNDLECAGVITWIIRTRIATCRPSLMKRFRMTPSTWIS